MSYELPCAHCSVLTRVDFLVDVSELVPLGGKVCEDCEHELVAELHDDDTCSCQSCDRARAKADRIRREADARTYGGLSADANELLGPSWLEEGGGMPGGKKAVAEERTAEDRKVFDALEHIEVTLVVLRKGALTRRRAAEALLAIQRHTEAACTAYAEVERQEGPILPHYFEARELSS